jgi:23S rRNA (uracil1939-C5)-methyltransferase
MRKNENGGGAHEPGQAQETVTAEVLRMGAQGDGVCRTPDDRTVFAPFVLPGESVRLRMQGQRAEPVEILRASPERVAAPCPHFQACGGCALQHWTHAPYLAWKQALVVEALGREGLETEFLTPFAAPPGSRRRFSLHARRGERGAGTRLGYKARRSWSLVDIEVCPIADPRLVAALPALRRLAAPFL